MAISIVNLGWIDSVSATTQEIELNSEQGYRIETSFSYDADQAQKAIAAQGKGATKDLDSFKVRFYNPDGEMIASYDNIVDGIVQANYFEFHYDRTTQQLLGEIDLGGESAGEIFLKGNVEQKLVLMKIEPSGEEKIMDTWEVSKISNK
ncbi:MAG: hypothetical protein AAF652_21430 [Cyanobacteria bacterium P01_C01_bin.72]